MRKTTRAGSKSRLSKRTDQPALEAIQVIDEGRNCTFPLYGVTEAEHRALFGADRDIAFIDEIKERLGGRAGTILSRVWKRPLLKHMAAGIHGTLFYLSDPDHLEVAKRNWPTRRECEVWPGSIPEPMRQMFGVERQRRGLGGEVEYPSLLEDLPSQRKTTRGGEGPRSKERNSRGRTRG